MTTKEFFIQTLETEKPVFVKVLKALPEDKADYKVHERSRTAGNIAMQLAMQPVMISQIVKKGLVDFKKPYEPKDKGVKDYPGMAEKNFDQLVKDLKATKDDDWDDTDAKLVWEGGEWPSKKFVMAWGFLFDAIHHRGQLTTFLRAMGAKVPSVYGGSADEPS